MVEIDIKVALDVTDVEFLQQIAEARHCTVAELVQLAVESYLERRRQRDQ